MKDSLRIGGAVEGPGGCGIIGRAGGAGNVDVAVGVETEERDEGVGGKCRLQAQILSGGTAEMGGIGQHRINGHRQSVIISPQRNAKTIGADKLPGRLHGNTFAMDGLPGARRGLGQLRLAERHLRIALEPPAERVGARVGYGRDRRAAQPEREIDQVHA